MLAELASGRPTGVFVVPAHLQRMLSLPGAVLERHRGGHRLRTIICNAAPLPEPVKHAALAYFGEGLLHECYGATETGIVTNLRPTFLRDKRTCVGTPFAATEVELRDEDGRPVGPGEVGELFSRSPYLFTGYHERPDETAAAVDPRGWATVGDLAVRDEDGFYFIVDRKKDMIISGGFNVYPREVENVILDIDGVADAAVIGVPDAQWGESIVAYVTPHRGGGVDAQAVMDACRTDLASFKVPREVRFVDALPRNAGGKVLKRDLREMHIAGASTGR